MISDFGTCQQKLAKQSERKDIVGTLVSTMNALHHSSSIWRSILHQEYVAPELLKKSEDGTYINVSDEKVTPYCMFIDCDSTLIVF